MSTIDGSASDPRAPWGVLGTGTPTQFPLQDSPPAVVPSVGLQGVASDSPGAIASFLQAFGDAPFVQAGAGAGVVGLRLAAPRSEGDFAAESFGFLGGRNPFAGQLTVGAFGQAANHGVVGIASDASGIGVYGGSVAGVAVGVKGESDTSVGVFGKSNKGSGVFGSAGQTGKNLDPATGGTGVLGSGYIGVRGETQGGVAILARTFPPGGEAGRFEGHVTVTGNHECGGDLLVRRNVTVNGSLVGTLTIAGNSDIQFADCAEDFEVAGSTDVVPGTLMALNDDGLVAPSVQEYDSRVVGVVSGGGNFRPGIILGRSNADSPTVPLALIGKAFCKVDADYGAIRVGDLLTSSPTEGHAMVVTDRGRALGAIVGKALRPLSSGRGAIPVLVWSR